MKKLLFALAAAGLLVPTAASAQIDSTLFETTATYSDDFAGGSPTLNWVIDPDADAAVGSLVPPTFVTATPSGIDADIIADDPVATATGGGVMVTGGSIADVGTHFGLNYVIANNSQDGGGGDDLTALVDYKVEARIWTLGTNEYNTQGNQDRWAGGPYLHAGSGGGDLFRATIFYQVGATGAGPGFYTRGLDTGTTFTTTPLTDGRWVKYSIMVSGDMIGVGYDADGNGTIDESDPAEFDGSLTRDTADDALGAPGINMVGEVSNDLFPMFVDTFDVFLPAPAASVGEDWTMY